MKPIERKEAAEMVHSFLNDGLKHSLCNLKEGWVRDTWHVGKVEFRALLDAIYGGPPQSKDEEIK